MRGEEGPAAAVVVGVGTGGRGTKPLAGAVVPGKRKGWVRLLCCAEVLYEFFFVLFSWLARNVRLGGSWGLISPDCRRER